jgi:hypothetical protein
MPDNPAFNNTTLAHPASALGDFMDYLTEPYRQAFKAAPPPAEAPKGDMNEIIPAFRAGSGYNMRSPGSKDL